MNYKVGDKVRLVSERPYAWSSIGNMDKYLNNIVKITHIFDDEESEDTSFRFEGDAESGSWSFTLSDIAELLPKNIKLYKTILNE